MIFGDSDSWYTILNLTWSYDHNWIWTDWREIAEKRNDALIFTQNLHKPGTDDEYGGADGV